jgi:hypothetical protein
MPKKQTTAPESPAAASPVFALMAGLFFFVAICKLGSPAISDGFIDAPKGWASVIFANETWPPHWGFWLFVPFALTGLLAIEWNQLKFHWVLMLPLIWLGWEFLAATQTVSPALSKVTLAHFVVCVCLFYLGAFAKKGMSNPWPIWAGMGLALCWAMRVGMEQHFGGLEATRKMMLYSPSQLDVDPKWLANPDWKKRMASNRIFGTFAGYPNSLAGGLELLLPLTLVFLWSLSPKVRKPIRVVFVLILGGCGLGCLYWSGSKAGWLVALVMGLVALGHSAIPLKWRRGLICAVLIAGVAGFAFKYASFFKKDQNSVGARFVYWRAALLVTERHPLLGTGPGTFQVPFGKMKRPDEEMARLCHNDYLEQGTDAGFPGLIIYTGMIMTFLMVLYRYSIQKTPLNWLSFAVWLGILGLCLHSLVDFHLYVAALAWPMFFLCGWLMRRNN